MANLALLTKRLTNSGWVVTGKITESSTVPRDVFVYENTGTPVLGKFHSVVMVQDMPRIRAWEGEEVPLSQGKFVRFSNLTLEVSLEDDVDAVIAELIASLKSFVREFTLTPETTVSYVLD